MAVGPGNLVRRHSNFFTHARRPPCLDWASCVESNLRATTLEPSIPESEFRARVEKVREFVRGNSLAALVAYSGPWTHMWYQAGHVGWLTNWANGDRIIDSMAVVPAEGEPVLLFFGLPFLLPPG